jgi:hypothetical protein
MNESKEWFVSECEEWFKNKKKSMNNEWSLNEQYVNDKHLKIICAFFVRLIICILWVTMSPPLLVPTNLKFTPIFPSLNVEAQAHPKWNASQPVEEPLSLNLIMKGKNEIMKVCGTFKINGPRIFLGQIYSRLQR